MARDGRGDGFVRYICDSCGYRGTTRAGSSDEVLCEMCGEVVQPDCDSEVRDRGAS